MIDHTTYLPRVLEKLFPEKGERQLVLDILGQYGHAEFHREYDRVKMAILKLAGKSPDRVRYYTLMACRDYRDVLSAAEYPNQAGQFNLRDRDPEQYEKLVQEDRDQYREWYLGLLWESPPSQRDA